MKTNLFKIVAEAICLQIREGLAESEQSNESRDTIHKYRIKEVIIDSYNVRHRWQ